MKSTMQLKSRIEKIHNLEDISILFIKNIYIKKSKVKNRGESSNVKINSDR